MHYKRINFPSECCCHGSAADLDIMCVLTTRDFRILCLQNLLTEDIFFKNSMANSSKWGRAGSKETVQCFYCKTETRLDNLERHNNVRHPGRPAKHRIIIPSNQHTLFQILDKQISDGEKEADSESQEKNTVKDLDEVIEMDDNEDDGKNEIDKITGSETLENRECLVSEDFCFIEKKQICGDRVNSRESGKKNVLFPIW